jgi:2-methylcitrate dehydratase
VTYHLAWHEIGGGQGDAEDKWDPKSRETADHSLPYVLAVALTDGSITLKSFDSSRVSDPSLRPLMNKIRVVEDKGMSEQFDKGTWPARVTIRMSDGRVLTMEGELPKGAADNPLSDDEVSEKFDSMVSDVLEPEQHALLRDCLWNLNAAANLNEIAGLFRQFRILHPDSTGN